MWILFYPEREFGSMTAASRALCRCHRRELSVVYSLFPTKANFGTADRFHLARRSSFGVILRRQAGRTKIFCRQAFKRFLSSVLVHGIKGDVFVFWGQWFAVKAKKVCWGIGSNNEKSQKHIANMVQNQSVFLWKIASPARCAGSALLGGRPAALRESLHGGLTPGGDPTGISTFYYPTTCGHLLYGKKCA